MNLETIILAGGQSRRMGRDKALLTIDGITLLEKTVAIAKNVSQKVWLVTPWRDEYQKIFTGTVQWLDDPKQEGGLVALALALAKISASDWVLVLACDLPYLHQKQLQLWVANLENIPEQYSAALVKREHFYEPLCGFYRVTNQASLAKFIANGGRSFQKWLANEQVFPLNIAPELSEKILFNCNTPEDFATLKANLE